jgi:ATP-dependent Clp protease ATP-binding subunit ClpB
VLDDGRLTDGHGRTVDFRNTLIVMTSNIGGQLIQKLAEGDAIDVEIDAAVREELKKHFRPEFLNRIDESIIFHRLSQEDLKQIVEIQLGILQARLEDRRMRIEVTDAAKQRLAADGYDPVFGARPLKRLIQREIENPLAKRLLSGEFADGDVITIDANGESFSFVKRGSANAV